MKRLFAVGLTLVLAACGQQAMPELPEGVACDEAAIAKIAQNPPDERANPDSPEFNQWYMLSYYKTVGCDVPDPNLDQ